MDVFGRGGSQSRSMAPQPQHFPNLLHSDPGIPTSHHDVDDEMISRHSSASTNSPNYPVSAEASPFVMSPWNQTTASPYARCTWTRVPTMPANYVNPFPAGNGDGGEQIEIPATGLVGSLVREEGHIYSLAAAGDLLYTGSDSKNIRVWKDQKEFSGFKSSSGLVKAIVISGERIYTGHQDGKIRVWRVSSRNSSSYKRVGTLPTMKDFLKSSMNPSNYVEVRRRRNSLWIKHFDAISCLSLNEDGTLLYSGSWDKTLKVWRVSDSQCLESITAHDDAVNSVVVGLGGYVFTGSADGTVKAWHREGQGKSIRHPLVQTLLRQECAVTALAISRSASILYCGSSDGLVNFWERDKMMSHGGVLRGHRLAVLCLAAAGCLVFSGSADKSICVWKREEGATHTCLSVLNGHTGPVKCIAVDTDKEAPAYDKRWTVYSGSLDKSVKVWKVSELVPDVQLPDDGCPQRRQYEYAPSPVDAEDSLSRRG